MPIEAVETLLYHQSGLLGVSGIRNDMRVLLESTDDLAREAIDLFCLRASREIGSLTAALSGFNALVLLPVLVNMQHPSGKKYAFYRRGLG